MQGNPTKQQKKRAQALIKASQDSVTSDVWGKKNELSRTPSDVLEPRHSSDTIDGTIDGSWALGESHDRQRGLVLFMLHRLT